MVAMAEHHITTNSIGLQCAVQCCYEPITDMNKPLIPSTSASQTPNPAFQKLLKAAVQRPLRAWTSLRLRRGGGIRDVYTKYTRIRTALPAPWYP